VLELPGVESAVGRTALGVERGGDGWVVTLDDGSRVEAGVLAVAVPPRTAARLLGDVVPDAAERMAEVREVEVHSLGFAVRADAVQIPYATFLIPLADAFHSIVTRDVVPDPDWRAFTFHFRPGPTREERIERAAEVLRIQVGEMEAISERRSVLPSPVLGHAARVGEIDQSLASERLAVTGNWFGGLAIEDCVLRSRGEWRRVAAMG